MKAFVLVVIALSGISAFADQMKPATLYLTCKNDQNTDVIQIVSKYSGSITQVNGTTIQKGAQLIAGTEGGGPYLQVLGGGYNITIEGGSLAEAFNEDKSIKNGVSTAKVWRESGTYEATCKGIFAF